MEELATALAEEKPIRLSLEKTKRKAEDERNESKRHHSFHVERSVAAENIEQVYQNHRRTLEADSQV